MFFEILSYKFAFLIIYIGCISIVTISFLSNISFSYNVTPSLKIEISSYLFISFFVFVPFAISITNLNKSSVRSMLLSTVFFSKVFVCCNLYCRNRCTQRCSGKSSVGIISSNTHFLILLKHFTTCKAVVLI